MEQSNLKKVYFDKGMQFINYSKKENWKKCVNTCFDGIFEGEDVILACHIMELLAEGRDFNIVKEAIDDANLSGGGYYNIYNIVLRFSNHGVEFVKFLEPDLANGVENATFLNNLDKSNKLEENITNSVAESLHELWRKTRLKEDGTYEPRWKSIADIQFMVKLDKNNLPPNVRMGKMGYEIDIANSSYNQLSFDWQRENYEAARVVAGLVIRDKKEHLSINKIGEEIHNEWLKRNQWAKDDPVLSLPFEKLPEEEKVKDLQQYKLAKDIANKLYNKEEEQTL